MEFKKNIYKNNLILYTITTSKLKVKLTNYGASINNIYLKNIDNIFESITISYENMQDYLLKSPLYRGATIGRTSGRIKNGQFSINNKMYQLDKNDNKTHNLHGGKNGFSFKLWDSKKIIKENSIQIIFSTFIKDMEDGFPGDLSVKVVYTIKNDSITIKYFGESQKDTLLNMTNHTYFNLSGNSEIISTHQLKVNAYKYFELDESFFPSKKRCVKNNDFNFLKFKYLKVKYKNNNPFNSILNHPFLLRKEKQIQLFYPPKNRLLTITTSYPSVVIYSNGYDTELKVKDTGICFECQHLPNDINFKSNPLSLLKNGNDYSHFIKFKFSSFK